EVTPEETVEVPDHALAIRLVLVEIHAAVVAGRVRTDAFDRPFELMRKLSRLTLAQIDRDLGERQRLAFRVGRSADDDGVAEVGLVLNPIEMDTERRRDPRIELAAFHQIDQRAGHKAGELSELRLLAGFTLALRDVVYMDDHLTVLGCTGGHAAARTTF